MKDREQILAENPLVEFLEARGIVLKGSLINRTTNRCAEVEHKPGHQCVAVKVESDVWFCNDCGNGGTVIDWLMRAEGLSVGEAMKKLAGEQEALPGLHAKFKREEPAPVQKNSVPARIVATYDYTDASGTLLYQACRMEPKSFRQRRPDGKGGWDWTMEGQRRVLYNLPAVKASEFVWIVEGEKDAQTINSIGFCATCNVGGAGKWEDSYSHTLKGKDVLICGDNDDAGRKHVAKVQAALAGLAKTVTIVEIPPEFKDVSEYGESFGSARELGEALLAIADNAECLVGGVRVPIRSLAEMEREYAEHAKHIETVSLSLGRWLPKLGNTIRPLVPGELVTIIADTGVGKTMILQNLVRHTKLVTLMFEMELPATLTFERFVGIEMMMTGAEVTARYREGDPPKWKGGNLDHIHVCTESRLTVQRIEEITQKAGLKIGARPQLILLDYVQLVQGTGNSRYERTSGIAEELKILAKATNTILVITSQVARNSEDEIGLHSAKDSGSIENSSGLVLGAWRESKDRMWLKVCKNTKGVSGEKTALRIGPDLMLVEELNP
jgi:hypothetical protein